MIHRVRGLGASPRVWIRCFESHECAVEDGYGRRGTGCLRRMKTTSGLMVALDDWAGETMSCPVISPPHQVQVVHRKARKSWKDRVDFRVM